MDKNLIGKHKRTSIYTLEDFENLLIVIGDFNRLIVLPNIWTEVDNLLNGFSGDYNYKYINTFKYLVGNISEQYLETFITTDDEIFIHLGLTDTLALKLSKNCDFLITSDTQLSDFAIANGIVVYDMVRERNNRLLN